MPFKLDYDQWIHLDAENLAETGIAEAYDALLPDLRKYVHSPASIQEVIDYEAPSYSVKCGRDEFAIYGPDLDHENEGNAWGKATFAFFTIVNRQLEGTEYRLYAINGGNDLGGMFLTIAQAQDARSALPNKTDWPYLPEDAPPWYGMHH